MRKKYLISKSTSMEDIISYDVIIVDFNFNKTYRRLYYNEKTDRGVIYKSEENEYLWSQLRKLNIYKEIIQSAIRKKLIDNILYLTIDSGRSSTELKYIKDLKGVQYYFLPIK